MLPSAFTKKVTLGQPCPIRAGYHNRPGCMINF